MKTRLIKLLLPICIIGFVFASNVEVWGVDPVGKCKNNDDVIFLFKLTLTDCGDGINFYNACRSGHPEYYCCISHQTTCPDHPIE